MFPINLALIGQAASEKIFDYYGNIHDIYIYFEYQVSLKLVQQICRRALKGLTV